MTHVTERQIQRLGEEINSFTPIGEFEEEMKTLVLEFIEGDGKTGFSFEEVSAFVEANIYKRMRARPGRAVVSLIALGVGFGVGYAGGRLVRAMMERF